MHIRFCDLVVRRLSCGSESHTDAFVGFFQDGCLRCLDIPRHMQCLNHEISFFFLLKLLLIFILKGSKHVFAYLRLFILKLCIELVYQLGLK